MPTQWSERRWPLLLVLGIVLGLLLVATGVSAGSLPEVHLDTGDQACNGGVHHARWASPYPVPVFVHRLWGWWFVGGTIAPRVEGWTHVRVDQPDRLLGAWGGEAAWGNLTPRHEFNFREQGGAVTVHPGQSITVYTACLAFGPTAPQAIARALAILLLWEAP